MQEAVTFGGGHVSETSKFVFVFDTTSDSGLFPQYSVKPTPNAPHMYYSEEMCISLGALLKLRAQPAAPAGL